MVYYSIDTYSVMIYNKSVSFILDKLKCKDEFLSECFNKIIEEKIRVTSYFDLDYNGIKISIYPDNKVLSFKHVMIGADNNGNVLYKSVPIDQNGIECDIIDEEFGRIRLNLSGSGLGFLRDRFQMNISDLDPEVALHDEKFWGQLMVDYRVSRCDFAFDYINYLPDTVEQLIDHCYNWMVTCKKSRIRTTFKGNCSFKVYSGDKVKCVYLGSHTSNCYLRIYDKIIEQKVKQKTDCIEYPAIFKMFELQDIESWFRMELQTRDDISMYLLFQPKTVTQYLNDKQKKALPFPDKLGDYSYILRYILDKYLLLNEDGTIPEFMQLLCDWDLLPQLIRNPHFVYISTIDKVETTLFVRNRNSLLAWIAVFGFSAFENKCRDELFAIQSDYSKAGRVRCNALFQKYSIMLNELNITPEKSYLEMKNGIYQFKEYDK